MANPPKKKGTTGETEFVRLAQSRGLSARRTSSGMPYDVEIEGNTGRCIDALATRPDQGNWLVTIRGEDFLHLLFEHGDRSHIEVKRYRKFALHTIWNKKFGQPR